MSAARKAGRDAAGVVEVRPVRAGDAAAWARLRSELWPGSDDDHAGDISGFLVGELREPLEVVVAELAGELVGFAEVSLRDFAEGCSSSPVGYLEGWYVSPRARGMGVGAALVAAAERWARDRGCVEFASDTELANEAGAAAHRALGFEESGILRCFRKSL